MTRQWLGLSVVLLAACGSYESPGALGEESVGSSRHEFRVNIGGVYLSGTKHAQVTEDALPFLYADLREDLGEFNESTDSGSTQYDNAYHVDNCRINESFQSIRARYEGVIAGIKDGLFPGVLVQFGKILHTTQDFYAHSNWVDIGQSGLVTDGYPFEFPIAPSGGSGFGESALVVPLQVPLPAGWTVSRRSNTRAPIVMTPAGGRVGLITGTYSENTGGSLCPSEASIPHGEPIILGDVGAGVYLSKDDPNSINHGRAKSAALSQTTEEFCRWARLVLLRHGETLYESMISGFVADRSLYEARCPNARGIVTAALSAAW